MTAITSDLLRNARFNTNLAFGYFLAGGTLSFAINHVAHKIFSLKEGSFASQAAAVGSTLLAISITVLVLPKILPSHVSFNSESSAALRELSSLLPSSFSLDFGTFIGSVGQSALLVTAAVSAILGAAFRSEPALVLIAIMGVGLSTGAFLSKNS